jgi:Holliday junction DNA helicase RuvB
VQVGKDVRIVEGIDDRGLDEQDRGFLRTLIEIYDGGPAGVEAIAATMGEEVDTLVDVIEPYLLQTALVTRTRQGRRPATRVCATGMSSGVAAQSSRSSSTSVPTEP